MFTYYSVRQYGAEIGTTETLAGAANLIGIRVDSNGTAWVNARKVDHSYAMAHWTPSAAAADVITERPDILRAQGYSVHTMGDL